MHSFLTLVSYLLLAILLSLPGVQAEEQILTFDAALVVENDVEVKARLTGVIDEIFVDRGSRVAKGAPLAKLQNEDLALEVEKAESEMKETEAEYLRAKSLLEEKLISQSVFDEKWRKHQQAVAEHKLAKVNFDKSIIRAPFNGMIVERHAKIGQRVVEDQNTPLFRITAMAPLLARIFVPEEKLSQISLQTKVEFAPNVNAESRFPARVKWISSAIDPASGTGTVLIELVSSKNLPKPGSSGKVILWNKTSERKQ